MFKLFNLGGPSVTGINLKIENLHLTGKTFAGMILAAMIIKMFSDKWGIDFIMDTFIFACCIVRLITPGGK